MAPNAKINILVTEKAGSFIKSRRMTSPLVMVNLCYRSEGGDGGGGCSGGCGGGGCGEGQQSTVVPYVNAILVDGGKPGEDFVKVETGAGIPVYLAKSLQQSALRSKGPIVVTLKGMVMKRLALEGLDLTHAPPPSSQEGTSCH